MNEAEYRRLTEKQREGALSAEESKRLAAFLADHPQRPLEWESDAALDHALGRLPVIPVPSNFTSQVLQRLDRELQTETLSGAQTWWRKLYQSPVLKSVFAGLAILAIGAFGWKGYHAYQRSVMVEKVVTLSEKVPVMDLEAFQNFQAIQTLDQVPAKPDTELLLALQESP